MRKDKRATRAATTITLTLLCAAATFAQVATSQTLGGQTAARPRQTIVLTVAKPIPKTLFASVNKPDVDLRPEIKALGISIRPTQNGRGTCSVFAMTFLLEFMYAKHFGMTNADLSEEYLNYASNNAIGAQVDGGFFDQIDPGYQKFGMVQEFLAPYLTSFQVNLPYGRNVLTKGMALQPRLKPHYIKKWDVNTGLLPSQLLGILFQLKQGRPVAVGLRWPKAQNIPTEKIAGIIMMKAIPADEVVDGHSIDFVGFKASDKFPGGGYLIFRNHWGTGFMEEGYGYMSFDYATKYVNDAVEYVLP